MCGVGRKKGIEMNILSSDFKYTSAAHTNIAIGWRKAGWTAPSEARMVIPHDELVVQLLNELSRLDEGLANYYFERM